MANPLVVTAVGMGTVFIALILLSLFTFAFNKLFASRMVEGPGIPAMSAPCPPPDDSAENEARKEIGRRKAAAIAVSVALAELAKRQAVFNPHTTHGTFWRADGRRRQLDRWSNHA